VLRTSLLTAAPFHSTAEILRSSTARFRRLKKTAHRSCCCSARGNCNLRLRAGGVKGFPCHLLRLYTVCLIHNVSFIVTVLNAHSSPSTGKAEFLFLFQQVIAPVNSVGNNLLILFKGIVANFIPCGLLRKTVTIPAFRSSSSQQPICSGNSFFHSRQHFRFLGLGCIRNSISQFTATTTNLSHSSVKLIV
jgi:hypothetical protein